jgi:hypothetical protein
MAQDLTDEVRLFYKHAEWCSRQAKGVVGAGRFHPLGTEVVEAGPQLRDCTVPPITKRDEQAEITGLHADQRPKRRKRQCLSDFLLSVAVSCSFHSLPGWPGRVLLRLAPRRCQVARSTHPRRPCRCSAPVNITTATCQVNPARTGTAFRTNCFGRCRKNNWPRRPREVSFARPDCCVAGLRVFQASATERGFKTLFLKFGVAGSPHRGCSLLRSDVLQRG